MSDASCSASLALLEMVITRLRSSPTYQSRSRRLSSPDLYLRRQLLAMKLAAWRDAIDRTDARLLLSQIEGSIQEVWGRLEPFVPPPQLDKASYALHDLWESIHGAP